MELLQADDHPYFGGDNNLANGTPHRALIQDAFAEHNLFLKPFIRGDVDQDGDVDMADAIRISEYLSGSYVVQCLDAADANDDGAVQQADATYILTWVYGGGPPPPAPFPTCGTDPTPADRLPCAYQTRCSY